MKKFPRFTKLAADGRALPANAKTFAAVRINALGIMVAAVELTQHEGASWTQAKAQAKKLKHMGLTGWRLPEVEEAFLICDRSKTRPALDLNFFQFIGYKEWDWMWTDTPSADSPSSDAWFVGLASGLSNRGLKNDGGLVLAVRSAAHRDGSREAQ